MAANRDALMASILGEFAKGYASGRQRKQDLEREDEKFERELGRLAAEKKAKEREAEFAAYRGIQDDVRAVLQAGASQELKDPTGKVTGILGAKLSEQAVKDQEAALLGAFRKQYPQSHFITPATPSAPPGIVGGVKSTPKSGAPAGFGSPLAVNIKQNDAAGATGGSGALKDFAKELGTYEENMTLKEQRTAEIANLRALNQQSYGGLMGAAKVAYRSATNTGGDDPKYKNTVNVVNGLKNLVSNVLKGTFGAQLSDSERQYLNEVYGAAERFSQEEREIAMARVDQILEGKVSAQKDKVESLGRTYGITPQYKNRQAGTAETPAQRKARLIQEIQGAR